MVMASPPIGFVTLDAASTRVNKDLNVIGVVSDFLPPVKSRGEDYMCSFTLCDLSPSTGQLVKVFRPSLDTLPQIQGNGDVVILRQVQIKPWSGLHTILSNRYSTWSVIYSRSILAKLPLLGSALPRISKSGTILNPGPSEILYGITLANALSHHRASDAAAAVLSPSRNLPPIHQGSSGSPLQRQQASTHKFSLIHNVQSNKFYDVVGEVIKTYPSGSGVFEVYITDYTTNDNLFNYEWRPPSSDDFDCSGPGDEYGYLERRVKPSWPGPYGRQTLRVALWPPHSTAAQSTIKEGDYVELRNVRVKLDQQAQLEGAMHGDRQYPDRVSIQKVDRKDERYLDVLRRKKAYAKKFEKQKGDFLEEVGLSSRKRQNDDSGEGSDVAKKKPKKRGSEQKRVLENREIQPLLRNQRGEVKEAGDLVRRRRKEEEPRNAKGSKTSAVSLRYETNKHVICAHNAKPVVTVSQVLAGKGRSTTTNTGVALDLPFQNVCCRAKVRVVDFFPPNLEDFAVPCNEFEDLSDDSDEESDRDGGQHRQVDRGLRRVDRWDWMFYLLVEDANKFSSGARRETMKVLVADRDAEYLLKMDAEDLRRNPNGLNLLREKLFILWGDLEERKSSVEIEALKELAPNKEKRSVGDLVAKGGEGISGVDLAQSSAKAFECCIKEYGVLKKKRRKNSNATQDEDSEGTWLRRFQMFETTINAF
ncbi:MAG: hypothetical protein M1840_007171 [Geoglossum simile]|nr:MAG: hypothetical protein M1840_007171 [Geoglossum simile]